MKFLLIFVVVIIIGVQAELTKQKQIAALKECVGGRDMSKFLVIVEIKHMPVDNEELTKVFECYWRKLQIIKEDGTIGFDMLKSLSASIAKAKFGTVSDLAIKTDTAFKQCKTIADEFTGPVGIKAIKVRNCLLKFGEEHHE